MLARVARDAPPTSAQGGGARVRRSSLRRAHGRLYAQEGRPAYALRQEVAHGLLAGEADHARACLLSGSRALARSGVGQIDVWVSDAQALARRFPYDEAVVRWAGVLGRNRLLLEGSGWSGAHTLRQIVHDDGDPPLVPDDGGPLLRRVSTAERGDRAVVDSWRTADGSAVRVTSWGRGALVRAGAEITVLSGASLAGAHGWRLPPELAGHGELLEVRPVGDAWVCVTGLERQLQVRRRDSGAVVFETELPPVSHGDQLVSSCERGCVVVRLAPRERGANAADVEIVVLRAAAALEVHRLSVPAAHTRRLAVAMPDPDTVFLALGHVAHIWRWSDDRWDGPVALHHPTDVLGTHVASCVDVARDGERVWTWANDGRVRRWRWDSPEEPEAVLVHAELRPGGMRVSGQLFAPALENGARLPNGGLWAWGDETLRVWDPDGSERGAAEASGVLALASPDGTYIAVLHGHAVTFVDTNTLETTSAQLPARPQVLRARPTTHQLDAGLAA
jgi:hypothetical protein